MWPVSSAAPLGGSEGGGQPGSPRRSSRPPVLHHAKWIPCVARTPGPSPVSTRRRGSPTPAPHSHSPQAPRRSRTHTSVEAERRAARTAIAEPAPNQRFTAPDRARAPPPPLDEWEARPSPSHAAVPRRGRSRSAERAFVGLSGIRAGTSAGIRAVSLQAVRGRPSGWPGPR